MNIRFSRKSQLILAGFYIALALGIFITAYYHQVLSNPYLVNDDDLSQIFYFYKVGHKSFAESTPIARYFLDLLPVGYKCLYKIACFLKIDPIYFSKLLTAFLFLATLLTSFALGYRLAGLNGALFLFTTTFICEGFFERMAGGLPRAFGYPMAFLFIYGVFSQNIWTIVIALMGSVLFYPPLTPFMALYASFIFLFPQWLKFFPLKEWSLLRRFAYLILLGLICLSFLSFPLLGSRRWGPMLSTKEMQQMPEMQTGGRYDPPDRTPSLSIFQALDIARYKVFSVFNRPHGKGQIFLTDRYGSLFLLLCLLPYFVCPLSSLTSLTALWCLLIMLYEISAWFYPRLYIPTRFVLYLMPIFVLVGITMGFKQIGEKIKFGQNLVSLGVFCVISTIGLIYAPSGRSGFDYDFRPVASLYQTIQKLPNDAVIAGWPNPVLDAVPLFGYRPILVGYETYQLFHRRYLNMMRKRMMANLQILFTDDQKTFTHFVQKYRIKYVLFPEYIYQGCQHLHIFTPFSQMAAKLCKRMKRPIVSDLSCVWKAKGYRLVKVK